MKKIFTLFMVLLLVPMVFAGTVSRSISDTNPSSGDTITITLTIDADTGDKAILIEDTAPFNIIGLNGDVYQVALIDQIGVDDTTKQYRVTVSGTGTKTFSGRYTVNGGSDQTITGDNSITIGGTCTPHTCSGLGYNCGSHSDGCGGTIDCGTCGGGEECQSGTCVDITPQECEDDDDCDDGYFCNDDNECEEEDDGFDFEEFFKDYGIYIIIGVFALIIFSKM